MIKLKHGVQVLLGCTLVYAAGCGGSTSPGDTGDLGAAGSKSSFAGATASAGYSSTTTTGTAGFSQTGPVGAGVGGSSSDNNPGGTGVAGSETGVGGGANSSGGSSGIPSTGAGGMSVGSGGAAGSGGQNSCPATAPTDRSTCTTVTPNGENCLYVGESCACRAAVVIAPPRPGGVGGATGAGGASVGAGGAAAAEPTWRCTGSGAACPTTMPTTGDMCSNASGSAGAGAGGGAGIGIGAAALDCPYPDGSTCRCTNRRWECSEPPPPACPTMQPTGACTTIQACNYGTAAMRVRCECDGKAWGCDMAGGAAPRCTAKARAALATGDTCTGIGECQATGTANKTCVCDGKTVTCN